jgi:hypothetical protein
MRSDRKSLNIDFIVFGKTVEASGRRACELESG